MSQPADSPILKNTTSRRRFLKYGILASIGLILFDSFWFEKYMINWNEFDISGHTDDSNKLTLIQISDLHLKSVDSRHHSIADKINEVKPDLILLTGDIVDDNKNLATLDEFLKLIDKDIQKIAITGNWEYWGNVDITALKQLYTKHNCELLINESKQLKIKNRTVSIIGIDDLVGGNANYPDAMKSYVPSDTNIILTHCPKHRDVISQEKGDQKIDLILSGHTHGGQINILGFVPFKPPGSGTYLSGWYTEEEPKLFVSKGIGTSVLPIRFGARAEVDIIKI